MRLLALVLSSLLISTCTVVTLPVKVATKAVGTAVDVTTTTADIMIPDGKSKDAK